jgi:hypothetical protein
MSIKKLRTLATITALTALGVSVPAVAAYGDNKTGNPPTVTTIQTSNSTSTSASVSAWKAFHAQWKAYVDGLKSINATYRAARATARATYFEALSVATTPAERQAARAAYLVAIEAAINARVAAITAAGDPPPPPAGYNGTAYVLGIQAANVAFRASVTSAQSTLAAALAAATTTWQREQARLAYQTAIGNAIVVRANALEALGPPPTNPGQPS